MQSIAKREIPLSYWITAVALVGGLVLSVLSYFKICSEACAEGHNYRLLGMPFEIIGIAFFVLLILLHSFSLSYPYLKTLVGWMIAGALGAELWFILMQKYVIGHWCPLCLSIAATLLIAGLANLIPFVLTSHQEFQSSQKGEFMKSVWKSATGSALFLVGFLVAFFGVTKFDQLEAAQDAIKNNIVFGNKTSPIELYLFTDWQCPSCRQIEPVIEAMAPALLKDNKLIFVDFAIHADTYNFTPFNLAFMLHNKDRYFDLRRKLEEISLRTGSPTEEMVMKSAATIGVKYQPLNFADVTMGQKYFKQLGRQFGINKTPTLVLVNTQNKKGKKLVGSEITQDNVLKAIYALKN